MTDDSMTAFPRVWRKADDGGAAMLPEEDITKAAPSSKSLSAHPSKKFVLVRKGKRFGLQVQIRHSA